MPDAQDSASTSPSQPPAVRKVSKITDAERRARKNDAGRVLRWLERDGAITRDTLAWARADRSKRGFNAHVCERLLKAGRLELVEGTQATYRLKKVDA